MIFKIIQMNSGRRSLIMSPCSSESHEYSKQPNDSETPSQLETSSPQKNNSHWSRHGHGGWRIHSSNALGVFPPRHVERTAIVSFICLTCFMITIYKLLDILLAPCKLTPPVCHSAFTKLQKTEY